MVSIMRVKLCSEQTIKKTSFLSVALCGVKFCPMNKYVLGVFKVHVQVEPRTNRFPKEIDQDPKGHAQRLAGVHGFPTLVP